MQTYTHLAIGAALGTLAYRNDPLAQLCCVIGAGGSDVGFALEFAAHKFKGLAPMKQKRPRWLREIGEAAHSLPLWFAVLVAIWFSADTRLFVLALAFEVGWISHIVVDVLTHGGGKDGKKFSETDVTFMWPLNHISERADLRPLAIAEYRIDHGVLWPLKPFEQNTLLACVAVTSAVWTWKIALLL